MAGYASLDVTAEMAEGYDPDAFDSMAVVNAEQWNKSGPDGEKLTRADILPHVRREGSKTGT